MKQNLQEMLIEAVHLLNVIVEKSVLKGSSSWENMLNYVKTKQNELKRAIENWRTEPNKVKKVAIRKTIKAKREELVQAMRSKRQLRISLMAKEKARRSSSNKGQKYHDFITSKR